MAKPLPGLRRRANTPIPRFPLYNSDQQALERFDRRTQTPYPPSPSPAISAKHLSLTPNGNVRYQLKTPYRDGMTHVIFEPLDFIARLAALVPKPRVNLTRFHGVFAPNSKHPSRVTTAKRGRGRQHATTADLEEATPAERWDGQIFLAMAEKGKQPEPGFGAIEHAAKNGRMRE